jgi:ribosomal protein S12 methylthiotransferase
VSLGCPKNLVDSEVMMGMLAQAGAELTPDAENADVIVVNTCSFIASAQQESIDTILEMARHKTGGKAKRLVVAGCLVERFHDEIRKNIPEVDAVVGTGELEKILAAAGVATAPRAPSPFNILNSGDLADLAHNLARRRRSRREQGRFARDSWDGAVADLPNYLYDDHTPRILTTPDRRRTSRSPRAAIILAPSASSPRLAASSARAVSNPSSPKRRSWPNPACAKLP